MMKLLKFLAIVILLIILLMLIITTFQFILRHPFAVALPLAVTVLSWINAAAAGHTKQDDATLIALTTTISAVLFSILALGLSGFFNNFHR